LKIQEIMTAEVATCRPAEPVLDAIKTMDERDCGSLPVVDKDQKVVGMITDRDAALALALALAKRDVKPSQLRVQEAMSRGAKTCTPDQEVAASLQAMKAAKVRRVPIVDAGGRLIGIVSINDIVLTTELRDQIVDTMRAICQHLAEARTV
jgi:CBS domain-containing protein